MLAKAGEALGFAIANLITLFAPPKVIISGRAMTASEHFIAPLRATVAALLPPSLADVSDIVVREWSERAWVQGAAAMTLRDLYGAPWGTTGPARDPRARDAADGRFVMRSVRVGVIGCGNISAAYLKAARDFPDPRHRRACRRESGGGRKPGRPSSAFPRAPSRTSSPIR